MNILLLANGTFLYSLGWLAMLLGVIVDCGADGEVCGRCVLSVLTCSGGSDCCWGDDGRVSASSWWAAHFSSSSYYYVGPKLSQRLHILLIQSVHCLSEQSKQ